MTRIIMPTGMVGRRMELPDRPVKPLDMCSKLRVYRMQFGKCKGDFKLKIFMMAYEKAAVTQDRRTRGNFDAGGSPCVAEGCGQTVGEGDAKTEEHWSELNIGR
jgi:hypothetical protein